MEGHVADLAAGDNHPGPCIGNGLDLILQLGFLSPAKVGQLFRGLDEHGALGLCLQCVHRTGVDGNLAVLLLGHVGLDAATEYHTVDHLRVKEPATADLAYSDVVHIKGRLLWQNGYASLNQ